MHKSPLPYDESSFVGRLLMTYMLPVFRYYNKAKPSIDNVPDYPKSFRYFERYEDFKEEWKKESRKANPSLLRTCFKVVWADYCFNSFLILFEIAVLITQCIMVYYIVEYLEDPNSELYYGVTLGLVIIVSRFIQTLTSIRAFLMMMLIANKLKNWMCMLVSEKIPKISYPLLQQGNMSGKLINSVSSDIELFDLINTSPNVLVLPFTVIATTTVLYFFIDYTAFIAMGLILSHLFIIFWLGNKSKTIRLVISRYTDSRIKQLTNLLEGIKIVKLYGWERPFLSSIAKERSAEIHNYKVQSMYSVIINTLHFGLNGVCVFLPIWLYIQQGNELSVSAGIATATILLISNLKVTFIGAIGIRFYFILTAACQRIANVLLMEEIPETQSSRVEFPMVCVKNAYFGWREDEPILSDVNFTLRKGEMLIVSGKIGSGKTALLLGILKEILLIDGECNVDGTMAYCGDTPWVLSRSIRDNILMGREWKEDLYQYVLDASALKNDISQMPEGDETLVGDRGVTLSGGQKIRLCLARALYADQQILILDDPLSAVDVQVSSQIFSHLKNSSKIVILATHQTQYFSQADKILLLEDGKQVFYGEYSEIRDNSNFSIDYKEPVQEDEQIDLKEYTQKKIEAEESAEGSVPFKVYWFYFMLAFKNIGVMSLVILVLLISQAFYLAIFIWLGIWLNDTDNQDDSIYLYGSLITIGGLYIFFFLRYLSLFFCYINGNERLHNISLKRLTQTNSEYFDKNPSGRMLNRFTKDTTTVDEILLHTLTTCIVLSFTAAFSLGYIFVTVPISLVGLVLLFVLVYYMLKTYFPVSKEFKRIEILTRSPLLTAINSMIEGLIFIRAMDYREKFIGEVREASYANVKSVGIYHMSLRFCQLFVEISSMIIIAVNVMIIVSWTDLLSSDVAAVSLGITVYISDLIVTWIKTCMETDNYMASVQRVTEYSNLPKEGKYRTNSNFKISHGQIQFKDVSMRYQKDMPIVLKNLNFTLYGGDSIGVIGRTGAGKSSLMQVLFRLTDPCEGTIFIDDQDYLNCGLHDLRTQLSVIPQTPFIFRGTIRENLDPFSYYTDDEVYTVLKQVHLLNLVEGLDNKIHTQVNSDELKLSSGQKQLICMARAIIRKNKIVMMDEATANIDHQTDEFIQESVQKHFKESTVIIIAHRLRTIIHCQQLIVMQEGMCVEKNSPASLANQKDSLFRKFIDSCEAEEKELLFSKLKVE